MRFCDYCGEELPEKATYCAYCGKELLNDNDIAILNSANLLAIDFVNTNCCSQDSINKAEQYSQLLDEIRLYLVDNMTKFESTRQLMFDLYVQNNSFAEENATMLEQIKTLSIKIEQQNQLIEVLKKDREDAIRLATFMEHNLELATKKQ